MQEDLTGKRFGKLVVDSKDAIKNNFWLCKCDCGKEINVSGYQLTRPLNGTRSCGCLRRDSQINDLTGKKIGRLKVIRFERSVKRSSNNAINYWLCKCDCGNEKIVPHRSLTRRNFTQSCGCLHKEQLISRSVKPNAGFNKVYRSYINRCKSYQIEFKLSVDEFYRLTQQNCFYCGETPSRESSSWCKDGRSPFLYNGIDRIDSNKGYAINNCVPCCSKCNYAKGNMSLEDFKNWVSKIYRHLIKL